MMTDIAAALLPFSPVTLVLQGGAVGLLAVGVLMVFLGWLIPRSTYRSLERDRDQWRTVALKAIGHTDVLLPAAQIATEVTKQLTEAMPEPVRQEIAKAASRDGSGRT